MSCSNDKLPMTKQ